MAEGLPGNDEAAPGDHLQSAYRLWLPGHLLGRNAPPWFDPYSFQPEAEARINFAAWPFSLLYWPLDGLFGTVGGWNAFILLCYLGAGAFAALWLRELELRTGPAIVGGLAFALAPYLVGQSAAGHLLAPTAMLLPLALWLLERGSIVGSALALASIPLSGQVHFALGAIPFFLLYAYARPRHWPTRRGALAGAALAVAAGIVVYVVSIRGTVGAGGRSFGQVERY